MKIRNCRCSNLRWYIKMLWVYPFQTFPRALTTQWPLGDKVHQVLLISMKGMIFRTNDFLKRYRSGSCMTDSNHWLDILASQMLRSAGSWFLLELQRNSVSRFVCLTSHSWPLLFPRPKVPPPPPVTTLGVAGGGEGSSSLGLLSWCAFFTCIHGVTATI